jgi:hypothetical protein
MRTATGGSSDCQAVGGRTRSRCGFLRRSLGCNPARSDLASRGSGADSLITQPTWPPRDPPFPLSANPNVWVVDVESGNVISLLDSLAGGERFAAIFDRPLEAAFEAGGSIRMKRADLGEVHYLSLSGELLDRRQGNRLTVPQAAARPRCESTKDGALIGGQLYAGVPCGSISPDGAALLYHREVVPCAKAGAPVEREWRLLDLMRDSDVPLRLDRQGCFGGDGLWTHKWLPNSDYLLLKGYPPSSTLTVYDRAGNAIHTQAAGPASSFNAQPCWSPPARRYSFHLAPIARTAPSSFGLGE